MCVCAVYVRVCGVWACVWCMCVCAVYVRVCGVCACVYVRLCGV